MKEQFELIIGEDGSIETIYQDGLADVLSAEEARVCRASTVEWEVIGERKGWVVRSAKDPQLALRTTDWCRWAPSREGTIVTFHTREEALAEEVKHFWGLFQPQREELEWAKDWEKKPCPPHNITGCMFCRYGEGPEPRKKGEPRDLECPRCHCIFADPDPMKEFPHGIICPECKKHNEGGLVGVIHPR